MDGTDILISAVTISLCPMSIDLDPIFEKRSRSRSVSIFTQGRSVGRSVVL